MTKIRQSNSDRAFWAGAAAITLFVYFFGLTIPLLGPDEPRYAQVAREMYSRGDWVTPTLGGFSWFEKPALLYWLEIGSFHIFGVSEFAARFGSALFGLGTIAALWLLGKRVETACSGGESHYDGLASWLWLIAATSVGLIVFSRGASFDIILTFPITAAVVCFFLFDLERRKTGARGLPALAGFYFFVGIALLAKGLIGIVFPYAIVLFYLVLSRRLPSRAFVISLFWGSALAAAVAAVWYVPVYLRNGWPFVDEFFIQHHFQRYTSNKYLHPQPFHFFFWVLPLMTIPWLPFFLLAAWKYTKRAFVSGPVSRETRAVENPVNVEAARGRIPPDISALLRFAAAWLVVPLVFFTFSGSKLPGYILPAVPAAIIIAAVFVTEFVRESRQRALALKGLAILTYAVLIGIIIFALPRFADTDSVKGLIAAADARGYGSEKVLTMHTVSHNAEFYAPGRLVRDEKGQQKRLPGVAEVLGEIRKTESKGVLVIVPLEYEKQITESPLLETEIIRNNGELAIAHVRERAN